MSQFYVPYSSGEPALITVNGHKLVVVTEDKKDLERFLPRLGGDSVVAFDQVSSGEELEIELKLVAEEVHAGVVVVPEDASFDEMIASLELELPWIH